MDIDTDTAQPDFCPQCGDDMSPLHGEDFCWKVDSPSSAYYEGEVE